MRKHKRDFKLQVAQLALKKSSTTLAHRFNLNKSQVEHWAAVYRIHGPNSFRHKELPYTQQFKLQVIEAMYANDWSVSHTSAKFDLSSSGMLSKWIRQYTEEGKDSLIPQKKGRQPLKKTPSKHKPSEQMTEEELREELEYLRAENAFLKKMEALTQ